MSLLDSSIQELQAALHSELTYADSILKARGADVVTQLTQAGKTLLTEAEAAGGRLIGKLFAELDARGITIRVGKG